MDDCHKPGPSELNAIQTQLDNLRSSFLRELPSRVDGIRVVIAQLATSVQEQQMSDVLANLETLHQRLHKLIGAAGTFGVSRVSLIARDMAELVNDSFRNSGRPSQEKITQLITMADDLLQQQFEQGMFSDTPVSSTKQSVNRARQRGIVAHVVDDDPMQVELIQHSLKKNGYTVEVFNSVMVYADLFDRLPEPAIIFMDMRFDGSQFAGADIISNLKEQYQNLPPVVFISAMTDIQARLAALRAGATRYLAKPLIPSHLVRLADELTLRVPPSPYRVMLVDDDPSTLAAYGLVLSRAGMKVLTVNRPMETLVQLSEFKPEVLILDLLMPDVSGTELAALIREDDVNDPLPILFMSAETDPWRKMMTVGLGGDEFMPKPVAADYLVTTVTARARRSRKQRQLLERAASTAEYHT
ncbi:response regulator [Marinobacter xestospongiae]|uniref:Response regulator n=1 Tax=Marinobacter xestospongiae TaxID=994319 RepID=A0ABU3VWB2_9GAMM|nr:response regulator [Marinobacter xestospongiae]MDV2078287.1 response regulator [Marinobacter xestospongiae]